MGIASLLLFLLHLLLLLLLDAHPLLHYFQTRLEECSIGRLVRLASDSSLASASRPHVQQRPPSIRRVLKTPLLKICLSQLNRLNLAVDRSTWEQQHSRFFGMWRMQTAATAPPGQSAGPAEQRGPAAFSLELTSRGMDRAWQNQLSLCQGWDECAL